MFNSTRISDSPRIFKTTLNSNNDTLNETSKSFLPPKIASTPLSSIFATPPKARVSSPRRYSLSEVATPPRTKRREYVHSNSLHPPGPLLASTKFNMNVSTYEDVKSPGLAGRIVQYDAEAEREKEQQCPATHQTKYGSVGLFPVVHLFKKKLPLLEQKPRHVTVRVASPDYMKHNPEYNKRLLEGVVKSSGCNFGGTPSISGNSNSTRSVLDALKEISRKRLHASEEVELHEENGKRLRTGSEDFTDSNKRSRDESPNLEATSPTRPASKKICMYDEYAASCSSMDLLNKSITMAPKRKSISISTTTENPKESKQVKVTNAETQTLPLEETNISSVEEKKDIGNACDNTEKVETVLKVFDDAPLERIRKNRLAALMGTLVGKEPILEPKPDYTSILQDAKDSNDSKIEETTSSDKHLVSILAPVKKSPIKPVKHVHFDIPETSSTLLIPTVTTPIEITSKTINSDSVVDTSKAGAGISSPIITPAPPSSVPTFTSANVTPALPDANTSVPSLFTKSLANQSTVGSNLVISQPPAFTTPPVITSSPPKLGGFKFDLAKPTTTKEASFSFGTSSTTGTTSSGSTTSVTTFSSPIVSCTASPQKKTETNTNTSLGLFNKTTSPFANQISKSSDTLSKPAFSFGASSNAPSNQSFTFGGPKPNVATTSSTVGSFESVPSANGTGFSAVTTSAKTGFSTSTSVSNKGLITSPSVTSTFGSSSTSVIPAFATGVTSINTTLSSSNVNGGFGIGSAINTGGFGKINSGTGFGIPTTSVVAGFGGTTSSGTSGFGASTTPNFNASSATPSFGTFVTSTSNVFGTPSSGGFGALDGSSNTIPAKTMAGSNFASASPRTSGGFGVPTTSVGGFGNTSFSSAASSTSFGPPSNSIFGFGNADTTSAPVAVGFGAPATTSAPVGFGAQATTSAPVAVGFGAPATTVNAGFGTTAASGFGTTTAAGFGTNSAPSFGNTSVPGFGIPSNNTPSFGSTSSGSSFSDAPPFGGPTSNSSVFGSATATTTPSFVHEGTNKIFGGSTAAFGAPATTTTPSAMFGPTQTAFGNGPSSTTTPAAALSFTFTGKTTASNTFGTTSTTTASFGTGFGQNSSVFGTQKSSTFGPASKTPIFGNNNASSFGGTSGSGFGGSQPQQQPFANTGSVFNKPQSPPQSAFGSTQFTFSQQQQPQQNSTTGFGTTPNQSSVFAFGSGGAEKPAAFNFNAAASGETPKKFDFTGGTTTAAAAAPPPAFGASFGGAPSVPTFGAAAPVAAGGFSIGAGPPSSGRPRTLIKGKRRT